MKINVLSYLEASAARVPDRVCWADAASALTYREAWTAVCDMGAALSVRLSTVNAPVCVLLRHDDPEELFRGADARMYEAKKAYYRRLAEVEG